MSLTIYHNPRCSKSRETLALIEAAGHAPKIIRYLDTPLSEADIRDLLKKLGFSSARELMRKGEADYRVLGLAKETDEMGLITAMVNYPKLIERPIVVKGKQAILGRPPQNVTKFL